MGIQVSNLTKVYGAQHAVDDISFEVSGGEVVGFLGPNGAGKSTTMKMLTCYILPTFGEASVCGYDIYNQSMEVRRRVGYLPEHNPLYEEMYVREYLSFVAHVHGISGKKRRSRIDEMVDLTGLGPELFKKVGQLSKGYRQRVGLAQAMIHDPEVLILDEPTSGLDPNQIVEVRNVIRDLGADKTVILSTHVMQEVHAMCNRVLIINNGKLVADDSTDQLLEKYSARKRLKVMFKKPVTHEQLLAIKGIQKAEEASGYWYLESETGKDVREDVFTMAVSNGNSVLELSQQEQSLEEVFHELTRKKEKEKTTRSKRN